MRVTINQEIFEKATENKNHEINALTTSRSVKDEGNLISTSETVAAASPLDSITSGLTKLLEKRFQLLKEELMPRPKAKKIQEIRRRRNALQVEPDLEHSKLNNKRGGY